MDYDYKQNYFILEGFKFNPTEGRGETMEVIKGKKSDAVNNPNHYNQGAFETIEVIADWGLGFNLGNTVKYISRYQHKGNPLQDLKKARFYLDYEIKQMEKNKNMKGE